jgi:hypothetical protein
MVLKNDFDEHAMSPRAESRGEFNDFKMVCSPRRTVHLDKLRVFQHPVSAVLPFRM